MPKMYEPTKHAIFFKPSELDICPEGAEQEHKDSCDINKMIAKAARGQDIRGNPSEQIYGYDDTTMDGLTHRINKEQLERELQSTMSTELFTQEEISLMPKSVVERFKPRVRPAVPASEASPSIPVPPKADTTSAS